MNISWETVSFFFFTKILKSHNYGPTFDVLINRLLIRKEIKRRLLLGRKVMTNLDSILKSRDTTLPTKVCLVKAVVFPVVRYGCESWTIKKAELPKNWSFWTVVLEKTLESPLDCKEIQPVHSEGDKPWVFFGRTDVEAETPILWLPACEELTHLKRPWW